MMLACNPVVELTVIDYNYYFVLFFTPLNNYVMG